MEYYLLHDGTLLARGGTWIVHALLRQWTNDNVGGQITKDAVLALVTLMPRFCLVQGEQPLLELGTAPSPSLPSRHRSQNRHRYRVEDQVLMHASVFRGGKWEVEAPRKAITDGDSRKRQPLRFR